MRVIAGEARGVPLVAPPGRGTRPTADRTKEAIFSVLGDLGCEGRVLDLFAGSGALGIEALSRGATFCDFVESSPAACRAIATNLSRTKLTGQGKVHQRSVERFVADATGGRSGGAPPEGAGGGPYDLILLDPPYAFEGLDELLHRIGASPLVGGRSVLLVEHAQGRALPPRLGPLEMARTRRHGDSAFTLYLPAVEGAHPGEPGAAAPPPTVY
jgi:16S rRNA (guanine966-N2)-methyltransferase